MRLPEGEGSADIPRSAMFVCHFDASNCTFLPVLVFKKFLRAFVPILKFLFLLVPFPMIDPREEENGERPLIADQNGAIYCRTLHCSALQRELSPHRLFPEARIPKEMKQHSSSSPARASKPHLSPPSALVNTQSADILLWRRFRVALTASEALSRPQNKALIYANALSVTLAQVKF